MNEELKPCPCGETPDHLCVCEGSTLSYAYASGSCCNEWIIEFRTDKYSPYSEESMGNAVKIWNSTKRGGDNV